MFTIFTKESKSSFTNRKWNYFSYFQTSDQKTVLTKMFSIFTQESKSSFTNRKWNYPNRKWNFFSYFLTSDRKNFYYKMCLLSHKASIPFLQNGIIPTGNGIIQTRFGINSPTSWLPIEKLLLHNVSNFY